MPFFTLRAKAEDALADLPSLRSAAERLAASIQHGDHAQKKSGGHERFWQFREYQDSDRPQDIDWRQSAKTDHVYVRERELQTPQNVYLWCNRSKSMDFKSSAALYSKQDAAQIITLASAILLQRAGEQIGFLGEGRTGRSEIALDKIGQRLLERSDNVLPKSGAAQNNSLFLCGDFLEPLKDIEASFNTYQTSGFVVQVLDPAELDLPYSGHVVFDGLGGAHEKIDNVTAIRSAYQDRIQHHIDGVEALCETNGWGYALHRTDAALHDTLLKIWEHLGA